MLRVEDSGLRIWVSWVSVLGLKVWDLEIQALGSQGLLGPQGCSSYLHRRTLKLICRVEGSR